MSNSQLFSGKKRPRSSLNVSCAVEWQVTSAVVSVAREILLCLTGRGRIRCKSTLAGKECVGIHGFVLKEDFVSFEGPAWTSWITLAVRGACELEIESTRKDPESTNQTFEIYMATDSEARPTVFPPSWSSAVDKIVDDYQLHQLVLSKQQHALFRDTLEPTAEAKSTNGFRVAVVGAKGVGKSTCLRYAANRLLSAGVSKVAVLDGDTGQPEFSPSGLLTLTTVTQPILSPPHMNMATTHHELTPHLQRAHFFGSNTSQIDPSRYVECLSSLIQAYQRMLETDPFVPLLINCDGWVKGLGLEVLQAALQETLHPQHVIQIQGDTKSRTFELDGIVKEQAIFHTVNTHVVVVDTSEGVKYGETQNLAGQSSSIPADSLRSLRICTYFLDDISIWDRIPFTQQGIEDGDCEIANRLAAMPPYAVPFEAVECHFAGTEQDYDVTNEDMMLNALNGSIVGLCCKKGDNGNESGNPLPCVGLGIVRSIDRVRRIFFVLTPVHGKELQLVDVLLKGSIALPLECVYRGIQSECFPFQSCDGMKKPDALGADPMKSRNTIARKSAGN